jgi:hypothetical protein
MPGFGEYACKEQGQRDARSRQNSIAGISGCASGGSQN